MQLNTAVIDGNDHVFVSHFDLNNLMVQHIRLCSSEPWLQESVSLFCTNFTLYIPHSLTYVLKPKSVFLKLVYVIFINYPPDTTFSLSVSVLLIILPLAVEHLGFNVDFTLISCKFDVHLNIFPVFIAFMLVQKVKMPHRCLRWRWQLHFLWHYIHVCWHWFALPEVCGRSYLTMSAVLIAASCPNFSTVPVAGRLDCDTMNMLGNISHMFHCEPVNYVQPSQNTGDGAARQYLILWYFRSDVIQGPSALCISVLAFLELSSRGTSQDTNEICT